MQGTQHAPHLARRYHLVAFFLPALLSLGAYLLTGMDHLGPGNAAAWTLAAHGAGSPADAWMSPLYLLLVRVIGNVVSGEIQPVLVAVNSVLMAMAAGLTGTWLAGLLVRRGVYGALSLAAVTGGMLGVALPVWLVALVPNPAPLASVLTLFALLLTEPAKPAQQRLLGWLLASLAVTALLPLLLLMPALVWTRRQGRRGLPLPALVLAVVLPLPLFLLPSPEPVLNSSGLFAYSSALPLDLSTWRLLGWTWWSALSPIALLPAVVGLYALLRFQPGWRIGILLCLAAWGGWALLPTTHDVGVLGAGWLLAGFAAAGVVVVSTRIPRGWIHLIWLVLPLLWVVNGPEASRKGEDIWEIHARNYVFPLRYNCLIATSDHDVVLGPVLAWQLETGSRPDVLVLDPTRLHVKRYVDRLNLDSWLKAPESLQDLDRLQDALSSQSEDECRRVAGEVFVGWTRRGRDDFRGGLFSTPDLEFPGVVTVPEGLLFRLGEEDPVHFVFRALDLGPIHNEAAGSALRLGLVQSYADMFTYRFRYLSRDSVTLRALDYIRWALRIQPDHPGARHEAERYNIHGEPSFLKPAVAPRNKRALPGVNS